MGPVDLIIILVLVAIVGAAAWYIIQAKKKGRKCIGCPDSAVCSGKCSGCCTGSCSKK